jgi:phosphoribosylformimino-5-aminoimidazole carboxamide ribotide isomerase
MQIWPAIDLLGGKCVRLEQGDYDRDTVFGDDPAAMARKWFDLGARHLHCVDLDGARSGSIVNEEAIRGIVNVAAGNAVQLGGGVRNEETIKRLLGLGLSRLVVGTSALKDPEWFAAMCEKYKGHLVLGLDARDGMVATQGWLKTSHITATSLITQIQQLTDGVVAVVYTDISRDGMLSGPNLEALGAMMQVSRIPVIASGGVTTIEDIDRLIAMDVPGCIIGRSLYEGQLDLRQVLQRAGGRDAQTVS